MRGRRQERRPLQRTVRIILECILVINADWSTRFRFTVNKYHQYIHCDFDGERK